MERKENGISDIKRIMMMAQLPHVILKHSFVHILVQNASNKQEYNLFWRNDTIEYIRLDDMLLLLFRFLVYLIRSCYMINKK